MPLVDLREHEDFTANPYPYYAKLRGGAGAPRPHP